jgi:hypothetical protein
MHTQSAAMAGTCLPDLARTLPDLILTAQRRLDELYLLGELRDLPRRAYRVLREYLAKLDLHRLKIGACFELTSVELEKALKCSERTVSYAHSDLVARGLIERPEPSLRGRRSPLWRTFLTPKALALLLADQAQKVAPPLDKEQTLSGGQGATPRAEIEVIHNPEQPVPTLLPDGERFHVRRDLAPLLQVLVPKQIKKLIGVAKRAKVWLQNVMAHRLPAILRANDPEGYVVHLIHSGEDWTRPVLAINPPAAAPDATGGAAPPADPEKARVEALEAAVPAFLAANAGRWLAKPDESVLVEIQAGGCVEHRKAYGQWQRGDFLPELLPRIVDAAQAGRLRFLPPSEAAVILGARRARNFVNTPTMGGV